MNPYDDDAPTNVQGTPPPSSDQSKDPNQKSALIAAGAGTAALGGAAYAMSQFLNEDETNPIDPVKPHEPKPEPDPKISTNPNPNPDPGLTHNPDPNHPQEQTFAEAFAEARTEHGGGGGYFEFDRDGDGKKEYYSTYLDSEWEDLSHHQKQDFYATVPDYQPPTHEGGGGPSGALHADTGIAHNSNVPPPVDEIEVIDDDDDVVVEVEPGNTHVAPVADGASGDHADMVRISGDEGDLYVLDFDHDDKADIMMRPTTHDALVDTDQDGRMDMRVEYDQDYNITHSQSLREELPSVSMQSLHEEETQTQAPEPESETDIMLASDSDFGSDFDNNADTSDLDYDYTA